MKTTRALWWLKREEGDVEVIGKWQSWGSFGWLEMFVVT